MAKVTGKYEGAEKLFENSFIIFGAIIIMLGFMAFIISVQNKIAISKLNSLTEQHSRQINYIEKMQEKQLLVDEYDKDECDWYNYKYIATDDGVWVLIDCLGESVFFYFICDYHKKPYPAISFLRKNKEVKK